MSQIIEKILADVCLDERVSDGIFQMENENHMSALRDCFVKYGITKEDSIHVSNKMLEGRFPEKQAFNKNGILVTFPTPQYKQRALQKGTHFEKNPFPQNSTPQQPQQPVVPSGGQPKPAAPVSANPPQEKTDDDEADGGEGKTLPEPTPDAGANDSGIEKNLEVEPPRDGKLEPKSIPTPPVQQAPPRTQRTVAAEKEVIKQILATDDTAISKIEPKLDEESKYQINELYKKAEEWGMYKAATLLKSYIK